MAMWTDHAIATLRGLLWNPFDPFDQVTTKILACEGVGPSTVLQPLGHGTSADKLVQYAVNKIEVILPIASHHDAITLWQLLF